MKKFSVETGVGIFLVVGFLCFVYVALKMGDVGFFADTSYSVTARFGSVSGLKEGAVVEIAGVKVGTVEEIRLDGEWFDAVVRMSIQQGVELQEDCIASIRTAGIIGERYVKITPGGAEEIIGAGGEITETESAINLEELVSKYIFEKD